MFVSRGLPYSPLDGLWTALVADTYELSGGFHSAYGKTNTPRISALQASPPTQRLGVRDNLHGITRDYMDSAQLLRTDLSDTTRPDLDPGQLQDHSENAQKSVRFPPNRPISRKSVCIHV